MKLIRLIESVMFTHSKMSKNFKKDLMKMPAKIQELAADQFGAWKRDNNTGGFRELRSKNGVWRIDIGPNWRAIGHEVTPPGSRERTIEWLFAGSHESYNKELKKYGV